MSTNRENSKTILDKIIKITNEKFEVKPFETEVKKIPSPLSWDKKAQMDRLAFIKNILLKTVDFISGEKHFDSPELLKGNIENYIGMTQVPTGIIGPLKVIGTEANDSYYVPMATSEGALIASYNRGAKIVSLSGGVTSVCLNEGVQRAPSFKFPTLKETGLFVSWVLDNFEKIKQVAQDQTKYGKLNDIKTSLTGNEVTLIFEYSTGDASGQNMVTICTYAACKYIEDNCPVKPSCWYIEGNLSGDKKASAISFGAVRGKKVIAEVVIKKEILKETLCTTPEQMLDYWKTAIVNGIQSGSIGVNGHFANGLASIFLACGQDIATISEASVGITKFDITEEGDLYASVTLPNMIVGTVGGGTWLPTQNECLNFMDCAGTGKSRKFAEICAAAVLCGEISIIGAIVAGDFARAHKIFGRRKGNQ